MPYAFYHVKEACKTKTKIYAAVVWIEHSARELKIYTSATNQ